MNPVQEALEKATPVQETIQEAVARLSKISSLEYEQSRDTEAKALGIRVSVLDHEVEKIRASYSIKHEDGDLFPTVEPWHEPIDPAALLDDIQRTVRFYIVCNTETAIATTLWIAFTWFIDRVKVAPIAMITAPEKRCGKSQLLSLIGKLSSRPLLASNISPAAIYRVIEAHKPTLLIDEADAFLKDNEEARGIINSGHTRSTAHVIRVVGDNHEPKQFSTWGAKAISGIGKQADTLMDRSVILELRRKMPHEKVERLRHAEDLQFDIFKRQLARFSLDAGEAIEMARPRLPDALNDRAQDNWEPLLAIADYAGGHWPQFARDAALKISGKEGDVPSLSIELLQDIQEILNEKHIHKIKSADLIEYLCEDDLRPWATYNRGKQISPRQLAKRLSEYGIESKNIRFGHQTPKGYDAEQFADAFARYIPSSPDTPEKSATVPQLPANTDSPSVSGVADNPQRGGSENDEAAAKPLLDKVCGVWRQNQGVAGKIYAGEVEII